MHKFIGLAKNDTFSVGCTRRAVYVMDAENNKLAAFRDIPYGYRPLLCPGRNLAAVKSTAGWLAFYDLGSLTLLKKIRFSKEEPQDGGFCFTTDGKYLYNLECVAPWQYEIVRYDTQQFQRKTLLKGIPHQIFSSIRYSKAKKAYCVLGITHEAALPEFPTGDFIAVFDGTQFVEILHATEYDAYDIFLRLTMP